MKRMVCVWLAACFYAAVSASTVNYTADNTTIFSNPERGFITMFDGSLTKSSPCLVKGNESTLDSKKSSEKMSIVLVHYYLTKFRTTATLPDEILTGVDQDMQVLRDKGMKAILRFSYTSSTSGDDAKWEIVQQHINQYKSHWQANADVIFCFQAGIVGAWGEWYYTKNYGNKVDYMNDSRRAVVDALLTAVPADRCIQLRTPKFKTTYMNSNVPLSAEEAYQNTAKARLGQHNDAFLYDYDNMGTYQDTASEKPWLAQETLYVPIGGETDITDVDLAKQWATYEKTTAEMSRLHWTFIQSGYATQTTNYWRQNGTFDTLNIYMGYRYQLVDGIYTDRVAPGNKLWVHMHIKNVGYAPLYNARPVYIVLKNGSSEYRLKMSVDPRRWLPNGVVTEVDEGLVIPSDVPEGTYQLYLHMPDAYASLASKPAYAVRFANEDVWDSATGMNKLNASVEIQNGVQAIDAIEDAMPKATKILKDGVIYIRRGDHLYNLQGMQIQ